MRRSSKLRKPRKKAAQQLLGLRLSSSPNFVYLGASIWTNSKLVIKKSSASEIVLTLSTKQTLKCLTSFLTLKNPKSKKKNGYKMN